MGTGIYLRGIVDVALLAGDLAAAATVAGDVARWDVPGHLSLGSEEKGGQDCEGEELHVDNRGCKRCDLMLDIV